MKIRIGKLLSIPFLVLLIISSALWLVGRLSRVYTAQIEIPVNIVPDYNSQMWVDNGYKTIRCIATADGRDLLLYKMGFAQPLAIPLSLLTLKDSGDPSNVYLYTVGEQSLEKAIAQVQTKLEIKMITDTMPTLVVSHIASSRVKVKSMVNILCASGYMLDRGVRLSLDSIDIKAPLSVLDTLQSIPTYSVDVNDARGPVNGVVGLNIPHYIIVGQSDDLRYEALSVPFTEQVHSLPIDVKDNPEAIVIPSHAKVKIRVPLSFFASFTPPTLFIDVGKVNRSGFYPICVANLVGRSAVTSIEPSVVQYFIVK